LVRLVHRRLFGERGALRIREKGQQYDQYDQSIPCLEEEGVRVMA